MRTRTDGRLIEREAPEHDRARLQLARARVQLTAARDAAADRLEALGHARLHLVRPLGRVVGHLVSVPKLTTYPEGRRGPVPQGAVRDPVPMLEGLGRVTRDPLRAACFGVAAGRVVGGARATLALLDASAPAGIALATVPGVVVLGRMVGSPLRVGGGLSTEARLGRTRDGGVRWVGDADLASLHIRPLIRVTWRIGVDATALLRALDGLDDVLGQELGRIAQIAASGEAYGRLGYQDASTVRRVTAVAWSVWGLLMAPVLDDRGGRAGVARALQRLPTRASARRAR